MSLQQEIASLTAERDDLRVQLDALTKALDAANEQIDVVSREKAQLAAQVNEVQRQPPSPVAGAEVFTTEQQAQVLLMIEDMKEQHRLEIERRDAQIREMSTELEQRHPGVGSESVSCGVSEEQLAAEEAALAPRQRGRSVIDDARTRSCAHFVALQKSSQENIDLRLKIDQLFRDNQVLEEQLAAAELSIKHFVALVQKKS